MLICLDVHTDLPGDGPASFISQAGTSAIKGGSGAAGIAAVHWLIDRYYETYFKNGNDQQQWAFQYAVWEIGNDYDGSAGSIDIGVGASKPLVDPYFGTDADFINAYQTMYQALVTALPSLPVNYRSQTYTLDLFNNQDPAFQSMVALVERAPAPVAPTAIPTLGQWACSRCRACSPCWHSRGCATHAWRDARPRVRGCVVAARPSRRQTEAAACAKAWMAEPAPGRWNSVTCSSEFLCKSRFVMDHAAMAG
ncbi:MAG TPA: hypothetical protein VMS38_09195 [Pseudorhodoferax sp.]|nr:hypothetical protein [Pseudorhodoferax sp.]